MTLVLSLSACTTVQNSRDLYFPRCIWGPYTKMLHNGIPKPSPVQATGTPSGGKNVVKPSR